MGIFEKASNFYKEVKEVKDDIRKEVKEVKEEIKSEINKVIDETIINNFYDNFDSVRDKISLSTLDTWWNSCLLETCKDLKLNIIEEGKTDKLLQTASILIDNNKDFEKIIIDKLIDCDKKYKISDDKINEEISKIGLTIKNNTYPPLRLYDAENETIIDGRMYTL